MGEFDKTLTLQQLLNYCCDHSSRYWESGWREFLKRYKMFIYKKVTRSCLPWNISRLQRQLSDTVNDVVSEVILQLCRNQCQALQDFHARDNEPIFLSWLAIICQRATNRYIQHHFATTLVDAAIDIQDYISGLDFNPRWELYEFIVATLRSASNGRRLLERDINIFQLYIWADFSLAMIQTHPCLSDIGHRVVDNVVNRMKRNLSGSEKFLS